MTPEASLPEPAQPPIGYVPMPAAPYRQHRKAAQLLDQPGRPRLLAGPGAGAPGRADSTEEGSQEDVPLPYAFGARGLMWKQDPSVSEIGTRKVFLPGGVLAGPRDARSAIAGDGDGDIQAVEPNAFG